MASITIIIVLLAAEISNFMAIIIVDVRSSDPASKLTISGSAMMDVIVSLITVAVFSSFFFLL